MLSVTHAAASGGTFGFAIGNHVTGSTYAADITTRSGYHHAVFGIEPDAQGHFTLAEAHFADGETSFVRIRGEGDALSAYSLAVSVSRDESVTESSDNTIRALSLGRSGTDIALRWEVAASNGKGTKIYFRQPGGTVVTVTPMALPPATKTIALSSQSLSIACGSFFMTQKHPQTGLESSATGDLELVLDAGSQGCDPPPGPEDPPQEGDIYVDRFHHRDHLGSLRVVTDSAGNRIEGMDYYPFGMELVPDGESQGATSRMKYTGHERDESAGMDYMLARYVATSSARFLSVDPESSSASASAPRSWNRAAYALGQPLRIKDPDGRMNMDSLGEHHVRRNMSPAQHAAYVESQRAAAPAMLAVGAGAAVLGPLALPIAEAAAANAPAIGAAAAKGAQLGALAEIPAALKAESPQEAVGALAQGAAIGALTGPVASRAQELKPALSGLVNALITVVSLSVTTDSGPMKIGIDSSASGLAALADSARTTPSASGVGKADLFGWLVMTVVAEASSALEGGPTKARRFVNEEEGLTLPPATN